MQLIGITSNYFTPIQERNVKFGILVRSARLDLVAYGGMYTLAPLWIYE